MAETKSSNAVNGICKHILDLYIVLFSECSISFTGFTRTLRIITKVQQIRCSSIIQAFFTYIDNLNINYVLNCPICLTNPDTIIIDGTSIKNKSHFVKYDTSTTLKKSIPHPRFELMDHTNELEWFEQFAEGKDYLNDLIDHLKSKYPISSLLTRDNPIIAKVRVFL
jgi:hypothetical protein